MEDRLIGYRQGYESDVPEVERIRRPDAAAGPADPRTARYLRGEHHPQKALEPRVIYVVTDQETIVGYIGGHLTTWYDCDGSSSISMSLPSIEELGSGTVEDMTQSTPT